MAIHPNVPGLTVSIDVAGQDLSEYDGDDAQHASSNTVTKYIEAVSGAEFAISYRIDTNVFEYSDHAIVAFSGLREHIRHHIERRMNGDSVYRAMMFSDLTTSEAEVNRGLFSKIKTLGTIVVEWYTGRVVPYRGSVMPSSFIGATLVDGRVPEKNLKGQAITHQTVYGRDFKRPNHPTLDIQPIGEPFAKFRFRYRSHAALQSMGILPRSPSPVPLEDRDIEDLNPEEMRELLRRQQRQRKSSEAPIKREIKRERMEFEDEDDDGDDVEIVDQPEKKRRLDVDNAGTEVVDLCGDD
ncbi:hypothetical protein D0864_08916 [Hortaea werneckii]|uniref:DUF7918 domain-containing protein n=1 Tax=Hortaea werneckii TaxID=91943 RepID=A0A3M7ETH7_HORWE|nr:hypothetical protein D0864_08916 [Hortaea werneckii]